MRIGATLAGTIAAEMSSRTSSLGALRERARTTARDGDRRFGLTERDPGRSNRGGLTRDRGRRLPSVTHETSRTSNALDLQKVKPLVTPDVFLVCRNDRPPASRRS